MVCKNQRSLKIHQSKSGCSRGIVTEQRTDLSETSLQGSVERRIETLTTLVYNIGKERFGVEERKERSNTKQTPNRREQKIKQLRKELKDLNRSKDEVEKYLHETHSDKERETPLGYCPRVGEEEQPIIEFETKEPTWKEVCEVVKKARTGSAPGYSGVPYKVYKKCPKILRKLWQLFRTLWKKGTIPESWQKAEGCFVPKEKD
ncbi:Hypothetical predicted protein [Mytilus galloprovincialis]|uniref:Reverse transcriptase domain-containing protein n=1 Tax=Mytilus galloprovincialis TaxID=29158 RepID=A0A8B6FYZ6_MYTGA|nr:Hypothetical predicted protein [Mytilus galloprovincialis]